MTSFLLGVGWALLACDVAVWVALPQRRQVGRLLMAATNAVFALADFLIREPLGALNAAACGYYLWAWWRGGGGDGTRRRLRRLRERFTPVRRTAPAAAIAVAS